MRKKILAIGSSGTAEKIFSVIEKELDKEVYGYVNDYISIGENVGKFKRIPVISKTSTVKEIIDNCPDARIISGLGSLNNLKVKMITLENLEKKIPQNRWINVIDNTAIIPTNYCKLGKSIFIAPLVQLSTSVEISDFCILEGNSYIGHDALVSRYSFISANAVVGSNVKIGKGVHVGTNSVIKEYITVGDCSIIGAGAVVVKDVPPYSVVVGNPARVLKVREEFEEEIKSIKENAQ